MIATKGHIHIEAITNGGNMCWQLANMAHIMGGERSIIGGDAVAAVNIMMDGAINSHKGRFTYHDNRRGRGLGVRIC